MALCTLIATIHQSETLLKPFLHIAGIDRKSQVTVCVQLHRFRCLARCWRHNTPFNEIASITKLLDHTHQPVRLVANLRSLFRVCRLCVAISQKTMGSSGRRGFYISTHSDSALCVAVQCTRMHQPHQACVTLARDCWTVGGGRLRKRAVTIVVNVKVGITAPMCIVLTNAYRGL